MGKSYTYHGYTVESYKDRYRVRIRDETGKRKAIYGKTCEEIEKKIDAIEKANVITVNRYFETWMQTYVIPGGKTNTIRQRRVQFQRIAPVFGAMAITDIRRQDIQSWCNELCKKYKNNTVQETAGLLRILLRAAVQDGLIDRTPYISIRINLPRSRPRQGLTIAEQDMLLRLISGKPYEPRILFLLLTGLRLGEMCALVWEDVDFCDKIILVRRSVSMQPGAHDVTEAPKTESSQREVPMTDETEAILVKQRDSVQHDKTDLVWPSPSGHGKNAYRGIMKQCYIIQSKMRQELGYPVEFSAHILRHTFATRWMEQHPESVGTLSDILGHSSVSTTVDVYVTDTRETKKTRMREVVIISKA